VWTSSSDSRGMSAIELLLGLSLAVCLAIAVAPLWTTSQSLAASEADASIWALQGRVAVARFEKDARQAGAHGATFAAASAVLEATTSRVVLLVQSDAAPAPLLVEWELVNGSLMRRWGWCPATLPSSFNHSLFRDSKTMLERVDMALSRFSYEVARTEVSAPIVLADLPLVDRIEMELYSQVDGVSGQDKTAAAGRVGR
jgi:type II secretory pathway pseudopilin PulG